MERFYRKYITRGTGPKFRLMCPQQEAHAELRQAAARAAAEGKWVKARDALAEAYIYNRDDFAAFEEAQRIEQRPDYKAQLAAIEAARPKPDSGSSTSP